MDLIYFVQGNTCFLLNNSEQAITELEFDNASMAFEDGFVVGDEYGRFRLRDFASHTFVKIYEMTPDDIAYLPRTRWFQLDIHRGITADGVEHEPSILKSVDKYGGYKPAATFADLPLESVSSST